MGCRIARPLRRDQKSPPSDVCLVAARKEVGGRSLVPDGQVFQPRAILTVGTLGEDSADRRGLSQEEMRLLFHLALVAGGPGRTGRREGPVAGAGQPEFKPLLFSHMLCLQRL